MTPTKADREAAHRFYFPTATAAATKFEVHWIDTGQEYGADDEVIALAQLIADTREREREAIVAWLRPMHLELFTDTVADDIENREDEGAR